MRPARLLLPSCLAALLLAGCDNGAMMKANTELRRENQQLHSQVDQLQTQNAGLSAQVAALQSKWPTTQILPQTRLDQLFTTHGLSFGRPTGFLSASDSGIGKTSLTVHVVPTDEQGQPIKAAGSFTIELMDLALPGDTHLGRWEFPIDKARADWFGQVFLYTYAFTCPLDKTPAHQDLLIRVTFVDALTNRQFVATRDVKFDLPAASTSPSTPR